MRTAKRFSLFACCCMVSLIIVVTKYWTENRMEKEELLKYARCTSSSNIDAVNSDTATVSVLSTPCGQKTPTDPSHTTVQHVPAAVQSYNAGERLPKHSCGYLDKYVAKKTRKCTILFEYVRHCVNRTGIGRTPLPNFFSEREGMGGDISHADYRRANVAFVHLPKAGGTSVESVLRNAPGFQQENGARQVPVSHCNNFYREVEYSPLSTNQTLYYSKRTYGLHDFAYSGRPFAYVTWFREPIARLVSTYYYVKATACAFIHNICAKYVLESKNLTDYLLKTRDIHYPDLDNYYVRLLQFGDFLEIDTTFEDSVGGAAMKDAEKIPAIEEKHYSIAKNNLLTKMAFIGLTEDFKTSQDMLSYIFGIDDSKNETHFNANPHNDNITDFELQELTRRNSWDIKLYEEAKKIYYHQKKMYLDILNMKN